MPLPSRGQFQHSRVLVGREGAEDWSPREESVNANVEGGRSNVGCREKKQWTRGRGRRAKGLARAMAGASRYVSAEQPQSPVTSTTRVCVGPRSTLLPFDASHAGDITQKRQ